MPIYIQKPREIVSSAASLGRGEIAYLAGNVAPVMLAAQLLQMLPEKSAHADDSVGHPLDLPKPLLVQSSVVENGGGNASAMDRGVGV
jgi:hypothetical protein